MADTYIEKVFKMKHFNIVISVILGLGLASLFRKACDKRDCMIFKAPKTDEMNKIYKFQNKCYKFNLEGAKCDKNKKIVSF